MSDKEIRVNLCNLWWTLILSEEWIFRLFNTDSGRGAMSGIDNRFIGQYEQAAANVLFQFVEITTGKVGTSDAALEKYVTGEHAMICGTVVNKATR